MGLFSKSQVDKINQIAAHSKISETNAKNTYKKSTTNDLQKISEDVKNYFKDSEAICIQGDTAVEDFNNYIDKCIEAGIIGIDTETTGLDRIKDHIVGFSLYYPGGHEAYIPLKHLIPIFDEPYKGQLTYAQAHDGLERLRKAKTKQIYFNADFDLSFFWKDLKIDFNNNFYYDCSLAWRCLKEDEPDKALKTLYMKYVKHGKGDPKKFSDFFTPQLFPYSKPDVAALYAANDAKITYELFLWQLPYTQTDNPKCQKNHLEKIARIIWGLEFPLVPLMQNMFRDGFYFDTTTSDVLIKRYAQELKTEQDKLAKMIDNTLTQATITSKSKPPFRNGAEFSPTSTQHVQYLVYDVLHTPEGRDGKTTNKTFLEELNDPVMKQVVKVRSFKTLINTFVNKLPGVVAPDHRIHANFNQLGASTGRLSSSGAVNFMNIPSRHTDIRHEFRATPETNLTISADQNQEITFSDGSKTSDSTLSDTLSDLTFTVKRYFYLYKEDGTEIEAHEAKVGDHIQMSHDDKDVIAIVDKIEELDGDDIDKVRITFKEAE